MQTNQPSTEALRNPSLYASLMILLAFALSFSYMTSTDVQWLTHEAQLFFSGGHYITDFIDPNAPLILFLYQPINWLHSVFSFLSLHTITSVYLYTLISLSIMRCDQILKDNQTLPPYTLYLITFLLAMFPMIEQGQRECLMMILSMPYLLNAMSNKPAQKSHYCDTLFATIGFLLRMHYLILPILIEVFLLSQKKRSMGHLCLFIALASIYTVYMIIGTPNYYHQIIPMVRDYYFHQYGFRPFPLFISTRPIVPCLIGLISAAYLTYCYKLKTHLPLLLGMTVSIGIYTLLQQGYIYHLIPTIDYWILLTAVLVRHRMTRNSTRHTKERILFFINCIALLCVTSYQVADLLGRSYVDKHIRTPLSIRENARTITPLVYLAPRVVFETLQQNKIICSRFSGLWMLTPFLDETKPAIHTPQAIQLKHNIQRWVMEDIERCHPDVIIANSRIHSPTIRRRSTIGFFSDDPAFQSLAPQYHLYKQVNDLLYFVRNK